MQVHDFPEYTVKINAAGDRLVEAKDGSFHLLFRRSDGFTAKWGARPEDDPPFCPWGNEIADIEITTACRGIRGKDGVRKPCAFCFPGNTSITMADGSRKDISKIEVGDMVLSFHDGRLVENTVMEVYCRDYDGKLIGGFANYVDRRREPGYHVLPYATPEHPFMVRNGNGYEEVKAEDLRYMMEEELLFDNNQDGYVNEIDTMEFKGKVYNFHCEPDSMYFADGVLVHNCYKQNLPDGKYMSLETFKKVFDVLDRPKTMTQIAFGVDAECRTNPDVWKIMDYCLEHGVAPNVTVADIDEETAKNIVSRCGACAVSCYERDKDRCYDSIRLLVDEARRQGRDHFKVNMHLLVARETEKFVFEVLGDRLSDPRLEGMGAIVLLSLKQKGRGKTFRKMDDEVYRKVIFFLQEHDISYGSVSCGANRLAACLKEYYKDDPARLEAVLSSIETCESFGMFSMYVNVDGTMFPCSFMEGEKNWKEGIDLLKVNDFSNEVWRGERIGNARRESLHLAECNGGCTKCPYYEI